MLPLATHLNAYWQYYQKTHTEEFPLKQLEEQANPQEEPASLVVPDPTIDEQTS
jgi:hypothetical protein